MTLHPSLAWNEIRIGSAIAPLVFDVTYSTLARDVAGTRDLYRIHHDPPFATANGAPNIFLNAMWYQGLIGRYITDWAGYEAFLRKLNVKIRSHGCPGDTLTVGATIQSRAEVDGKLLVDLDIRIDNGRRADAIVAVATVEIV